MNDSRDAYIERDFWSVWEAARTLFPSGLSTADYQCLTGGAMRTTQSPLLHADFAGMLLPGLAALGVTAQLLPLPGSEESVIPYLRGLSLTALIPIFSFAFDPQLLDVLPEASEFCADISPEQQDRECTIIRQGVATDFVFLNEPSVSWQDSGAETRSSTLAEFCALFTHALSLRRAAAKGTRRANIGKALQRWVVFAAAYPDRVVTDQPYDNLPRAQAAAILQQTAGKGRDLVSNRLRRAGERFADGAVEEALSLLREAVLLQMNLPVPVYSALMLPASTPLHEMERRELIYLARAGNRDLKVLAARRLASERAFPEVIRTLEQLAYDPDPWVRATSADEGVME